MTKCEQKELRTTKFLRCHLVSGVAVLLLIALCPLVGIEVNIIATLGGFAYSLVSVLLYGSLCKTLLSNSVSLLRALVVVFAKLGLLLAFVVVVAVQPESVILSAVSGVLTIIPASLLWLVVADKDPDVELLE